MSRQVIDRKYLPTRPIGLSAWLAILLAMDYWGAPLWLWYIGCTLLGLVTISGWAVCLTERLVHPVEVSVK